MEERRQRIDTSPRGLLFEAGLASAFFALPYRHPVAGWPGDLEHLSRPQAREFFRAYYAPNNALAVLVGDLDPAEVIRTVERYFGDIPAQPAPTWSPSGEPPQAGERRVRVEFSAEPQLLMLYRLPGLGHPDTHALEVLGNLLGTGGRPASTSGSSRSSGSPAASPPAPGSCATPGLFVVQATPRAPTRWRRSRRRSRTRSAAPRPRCPPTARCEGPQPARGGRRAEPRLESGLASRLGAAWALTGDWRTAFEERKRIQAVTPDEVRAAASRYLVPPQRTVVTLVRAAGAAPAPRPARPDGAARPWETH